MLDLTSKALLVASLRNRLFASRDTVDEALNYAVATIEQLDNVDRASMYTTLHIVMNTVADKIDALPDSSTAVLEPPPAEVRIDHADLPATGAGSLHDQIEDIVLAQLSELGKAIDKKIESAIKTQLNAVDYKIRAVDDRLENWFDNNLDIIDERITEVVRNISFSIEVD
jgi:hypothetical protein